ncbi:hypothetical protein CJU90_1590 [Yarrowia sp. C11]|nr:hypothetical protein CKK34_0314 [Yarrowia sp. E02]KAG5371552.1 hypothetical protein CJU90_1590 [Yarrowia sp. C11]
MRRYIALLQAVVLSLLLAGVWLHFGFPRLQVVAELESPVVESRSQLLFKNRIHTFVIDDTESCQVPRWISTNHTTGTLVTIKEGCKAPPGWDAVSHKASTPVVLSLWLCSQTKKSHCLVIHNSGSTPFGAKKAKKLDLDPLDQLVEQTVGSTFDNKLVWRCNDNFAQSCMVVPKGGGFCLMEKVRDEKKASRINRNWPKYVDQCRLKDERVDWYEGL